MSILSSILSDNSTVADMTEAGLNLSESYNVERRGVEATAVRRPGKTSNGVQIETTYMKTTSRIKQKVSSTAEDKYLRSSSHGIALVEFRNLQKRIFFCILLILMLLASCSGKEYIDLTAFHFRRNSLCTL